MMMRRIAENAVLLVIDVQKGFDEAVWGRRNNPQAEENIARLLDAWRRTSRPVIFVQHVSRQPGSPLRPHQEGSEIKDAVRPEAGEAVVQKHVNSAFIGTDLEARLRREGWQTLVLVGLTTPHCVSTTARMGGNLGCETWVVADATAAFDLKGHDGKLYAAEDVHALSLASLHDEFATITDTGSLLRQSGATGATDEASREADIVVVVAPQTEREAVFPATAFHILTS